MSDRLKLVRMPSDMNRPATSVHAISSQATLTAAGEPHAHDFHQITLLLSTPKNLSWWLEDVRNQRSRWTAGQFVLCPARVATGVRTEQSFDSITVRLTTTLINRVRRQTGRTNLRLRPLFGFRDRFLETVAHKLAADIGSDRMILSESLGTVLAVPSPVW
ncbi:hypothetical protein DTL42_18525 [Bremerella cremea]|uniref:Uncharacterized protein n=1 Tax=Bremerella cremea TaxID=1031537 RepID=A0A368KMU9_9BACT|nr:hypothetical protein [Bremerella cremea]RCS43980.1 hypothetical protein DTL42_18525 [Bremerella cremea]